MNKILRCAMLVLVGLLLLVISSLGDRARSVGIGLELVCRVVTRHPAQAVAVEVSKRRIYVAGGDSLTEFAELPPRRPVPTAHGTIRLPVPPVAIQAKGTYVYVAGADGVYLVDVSLRRIIRSYSGLDVGGLHVQGDYAYVTLGSPFARRLGLYVFNRSLIRRGALVLDCCGYDEEPCCWAGDVAISPPHAYLVTGSWCGYAEFPSANLLVVNVSWPSQPRLLGACSLSLLGPTGIQVVEGYVYVVGATMYPPTAPDSAGGLLILNAMDPAEPRQLSFFDTPRKLTSLAVSLPFACATDASGGVWVIDVSNPAHPALVAFYDTGFPAHDIFVSKPYIYVADGDGGLVILRLTSGPTFISTYTAIPTSTSTHTPTPAPTYTPTPTQPLPSTPTESPTPTPTEMLPPTPTATPTLRRIYLPVITKG